MLIRYVVDGGYANQMRTVCVHEDGTVVLVRGGVRSRRQWAAEQVRALVDELEASGLFVEDHDFPAVSGADLQRFEIRYAGATVVAHDTTVPPALTGPIARLERLLSAPPS